MCYSKLVILFLSPTGERLNKMGLLYSKEERWAEVISFKRQNLNETEVSVLLGFNSETQDETRSS